MRPHKKTLLAAACATGLLLGTGRCRSPEEPEVTDDPRRWTWNCNHYDVGNGEMIYGGELGCAGDGSEPCEVILNRCVYYSLDKYRIVFDFDRGEIFSHPSMSRYSDDDHAPSRKDANHVSEDYPSPPPEPKFFLPESSADLIRSVKLSVSVFDTEVGIWSRSHFYLYEALVTPEVRYADTVWGKLRKKGESTYYAWHVLSPSDQLDHYIQICCKGSSPRKYYWNPGSPDVVDWFSGGEKEALDALAEEVSLRLLFVNGWEAYDLKFRKIRVDNDKLQSAVESPNILSEMSKMPDHLRRTFMSEKADSLSLVGFRGGTGSLKFKIRKR